MEGEGQGEHGGSPERRLYPRVRFRQPVSITGGGRDLGSGEASDISLGGMGVVCGSALRRGERVQVDFPSFTGLRVRVEGVVAWQRPPRGRGGYAEQFETGVRFMNLSPTERIELTDLVEAIELSSEPRTLGGRERSASGQSVSAELSGLWDEAPLDAGDEPSDPRAMWRRQQAHIRTALSSPGGTPFGGEDEPTPHDQMLPEQAQSSALDLGDDPAPRLPENSWISTRAGLPDADSGEGMLDESGEEAERRLLTQFFADERADVLQPESDSADANESFQAPAAAEDATEAAAGPEVSVAGAYSSPRDEVTGVVRRPRRARPRIVHALGVAGVLMIFGSFWGLFRTRTAVEQNEVKVTRLDRRVGRLEARVDADAPSGAEAEEGLARGATSRPDGFEPGRMPSKPRSIGRGRPAVAGLGDTVPTDIESLLDALEPGPGADALPQGRKPRPRTGAGASAVGGDSVARPTEMTDSPAPLPVPAGESNNASMVGLPQRLSRAAGRERFRVEVSEGFRFRYSHLQAPPRFVLDLLEVSYTGAELQATYDASVVRRVRVGQHSDRLRLVFDLARNGVRGMVRRENPKTAEISFR